MYPPEIIDHVLSHLQWDHATLQVCARAHSIISKLAERYIYAHLSVQIGFVSRTLADVYYPRELFQLVKDKPDISQYARSLRITLSMSPWRRIFSSDYEKLGWILPLLRQLKAIFLDSNPTVTDWNFLPESFRIAFTNCLRLSTLTNISVSAVHDFPLSTLDRSRSLKRVSLSGRFSYDDTASSIAHLSVDSLLLNNCSSIPNVTAWATIRNLRSLVFNGDLTLLSRLLGICANSLTTLKICIPDLYRTRQCLISKVAASFKPIPFSLACLPHLEQLLIRSSVSFTYQFWVNSISDPLELQLAYCCLPAIMQLLNTLPSPPTNLTHLLIWIDIDLDNSYADIPEVDWSPLSSFPYFDVVPSVELRVQARKNRQCLPSIDILNTLKQNSHLMQLERHRSFLMNAAEIPCDLDQW